MQLQHRRLVSFVFTSPASATRRQIFIADLCFEFQQRLFALRKQWRTTGLRSSVPVIFNWFLLSTCISFLPPFSWKCTHTLTHTKKLRLMVYSCSDCTGSPKSVLFSSSSLLCRFSSCVGLLSSWFGDASLQMNTRDIPKSFSPLRTEY